MKHREEREEKFFFFLIQFLIDGQQLWSLWWSIVIIFHLSSLIHISYCFLFLGAVWVFKKKKKSVFVFSPPSNKIFHSSCFHLYFHLSYSYSSSLSLSLSFFDLLSTFIVWIVAIESFCQSKEGTDKTLTQNELDKIILMIVAFFLVWCHTN